MKDITQRFNLNNIPSIFSYIWISFFLIFPFLYILFLSLYNQPIGPNLEQQIIVWHDWIPTLNLSLKNFYEVITNKIYINTFFYTLKISFISTVLCVLIGYPIAYSIYKMSFEARRIAILLIILPSLIPSIVRIYAISEIIRENGYINNILINLLIISTPIQIMYTDISVYIGIIYIYLPFMILPIYANLTKIDNNILDAAKDLGSKSKSIFTKIIFPLSLPGIITGSILIFVASFGEFIIPEIMGSSKTPMISSLIWKIFFTNRDWQTAAALTITIFFIIAPPIIWIQRSFGRIF